MPLVLFLTFGGEDSKINTTGLAIKVLQLLLMFFYHFIHFSFSSAKTAKEMIYCTHFTFSHN